MPSASICTRACAPSSPLTDEASSSPSVTARCGGSARTRRRPRSRGACSSPMSAGRCRPRRSCLAASWARRLKSGSCGTSSARERRAAALSSIRTTPPLPQPDLMSQRKIARVLLSVSDKTGLVDFAKGLRGYRVEIVSTGGTAKLLREAGIAVIDVAEVTQSPEMMGGRVQTVHPKIHGGLLAVRGDEAHERALEEHAIPAIDLLAVNLYPFGAAVASGADFDACIENIDIGGPALIRAGAKNHASVTVVVEPADYPLVLAELAANDG